MDNTLIALYTNAVEFQNRLEALYDRLMEALEKHITEGTPLPEGHKQLNRIVGLYRTQAGVCSRLSAQVAKGQKTLEKQVQKEFARMTGQRGAAPAPTIPRHGLATDTEEETADDEAVAQVGGSPAAGARPRGHAGAVSPKTPVRDLDDSHPAKQFLAELAEMRRKLRAEAERGQEMPTSGA